MIGDAVPWYHTGSQTLDLTLTLTPFLAATSTMVLTVAAPQKRRRLDSVSSNSDVDDGDDENASGSASSPPRDMSPNASSSSAAKHQCDICGKSFARNEHMLRHRASHIDKASYSCPDCGKHFRRSDVLQRHRKLHVARQQLTLDVNNTNLTKRQRSALSRVGAACLACSSKKLKCDAAQPCCSRCLSKPGTVCIYPTSSTSGSTSPRATPARERDGSVSIMDDTSILDDSGMLDASSMDFGMEHLSPPPSLGPHPVQANNMSPARLSSFQNPAPMVTFASTHGMSLPSSEYVGQAAASATTYNTSPFSATSTQNIEQSLPSSSTHTSHQVSGATPGLVDLLQGAATHLDRNLDPVLVTSEPSFADLVSWLDGPSAPIQAAPPQSDWFVGESPEAPQLLDWSQMQTWTNFDLVANAPESLAADHFTSTYQQPYRSDMTSLHRRNASTCQSFDNASPLFVLSSAAEMIEDSPRTPHPFGKTPAEVGGVASTPQQAGSSTPRQTTYGPDSRGIAGRRSRWNSPDPVDEDPLSSDSARSRDDNVNPQHSATRSATAAKDSDNLRPHPSLRGNRSSRQSAAAIEAWPNRWNPAIKENSLPGFSFTKASEEHLMSEDMAHVPSVTNLGLQRMIEHLRNAAATPLEQERFNATFETIDAATLNLYLQLFFQHGYSFLPAIHQATFHPDRCDPRLLAALCVVGAFFSEVPGSTNAAIYLASLTQVSVSRATLANHAHARVTSTFQAILLIYMVWRSIGVPSRQEYAEAFRSTYCTMIRRCRLLEDIQPPKMAADAKLEDRWMAWIAWESGRRTAWSTLLSETELSLHWSLPEAFAPDELTGKLPCDDRLWEAPTAIEWAQLALTLSSVQRGVQIDAELLATIPAEDDIEAFTWPDNSYDLDVASVCGIIHRAAETGQSCSVTKKEKDMISGLPPFSRLCVGSALMLSTHHTLKMARFCPMIFDDQEKARERMRDYLAAATHLLSTNNASDARIDLLLHAIQLFELISPEMLQLLSCRRGVKRMHAARRGLQEELKQAQPWKTGSIVFHAGQMLRLAKQSSQRAPVECFHIFYAAIALQAVSLVVLQQDEAKHASGRIFRIAFNGPPPSAATLASLYKSQHESLRGLGRLRTDSAASSAVSSTSPSSVGHATYSTAATSTTSTTPKEHQASGANKITFMLESVGNLAHPMAAEKVLSLAARWLKDESGVGVWPIGKSLAKILDALGSLTPRQSAVS